MFRLLLGLPVSYVQTLRPPEKLPDNVNVVDPAFANPYPCRKRHPRSGGSRQGSQGHGDQEGLASLPKEARAHIRTLNVNSRGDGRLRRASLRVRFLAGPTREPPGGAS